MTSRKNNKSRQAIITTYHEFVVKNPQGKKYTFIKQIAYKLGYSLDKKNGSNSYVMRIIREWEEAK